MVAALLLLFALFSLGSFLFSTFGETNQAAMANLSPDFAVVFFGGLLGGFQPVDLWLVTLFAHPLLVVVLVAAIVGPVARDLAGEVDRGTLDLLLGCPIPRWVLPTSVWLAAQVVLLAIPLVLWAALHAGGNALGVDSLDGEAVLTALPKYRGVLLQLWLLGQAVLGVSLWFSARETIYGRALAKTLGFLILSYFLNLLAGLWAPITAVGWWSIFHYYQPQPILSGHSQTFERAILVGFSLVLAIGGAVSFQRRDIDGV